MTNYRIVEAVSPEELETQVVELLALDWELQGGVAVMAIGDDSYIYAQPMVRR